MKDSDLSSDTDKPESLLAPINNLLTHTINLEMVSGLLQNALVASHGSVELAKEGANAAVRGACQDLLSNQDPAKRKVLMAGLVNLIVAAGLLDMTALAYEFDPKDET